jgi:hypothetical protein
LFVVSGCHALVVLAHFEHLDAQHPRQLRQPRLVQIDTTESSASCGT